MLRWDETGFELTTPGKSRPQALVFCEDSCVLGPQTPPGSCDMRAQGRTAGASEDRAPGHQESGGQRGPSPARPGKLARTLSPGDFVKEKAVNGGENPHALSTLCSRAVPGPLAPARSWVCEAPPVGLRGPWFGLRLSSLGPRLSILDRCRCLAGPTVSAESMGGDWLNKCDLRLCRGRC